MTTVGTSDLLHAHCRPHQLHLHMMDMTHCATFRAYFFVCFPSLFTEAGDRIQRSYVSLRVNWADQHAMFQTLAVEYTPFQVPLLSSFRERSSKLHSWGM